MKKILCTLIILCLLLSSTNVSFAQGCVAIKGSGGSCMLSHVDSSNQASWLLSTSARYFKSFRHFSGTEENTDRLVQNTEVINHTAIFDIALTRILNNRWSIMIDAPIISNARSSLYEHGRKERHSMHSFGLGDIRVTAYRWLLNPEKSIKGNIQFGVGIKLPTGDYNYKDYWYNVGPNGTKELRTVDQSIQLGDGGTGFTVETNGFYNIARNVSFYGNFYYLINPREQNGVRTYRETVSPTLANEAIMSVPDQYMLRGGFNYALRSLKGFSVAAGARLEGIPVHDLIGGSGDFRRPGYIWSAEPTLNYSRGNCSFFASVPFAVVRNRTQSVTDQENSKTRGTFVRGDAAFADYTINIGMSFKF
ncbi:MAG TPA: hypothetical protein VF623_15355 [Segetibacter sp.]